MIGTEARPELFQPLFLPPGCQNEPGLIERVCMFIPVLGWLVASLIESRRLERGQKILFQQIHERPPVPIEVWGSAERQKCAAVVVKAIQRLIGLPTGNVIPQDQLGLLLYGGDELELFSLLHEIEEELGLPMREPSWDEVLSLWHMPLGGIVDHMLERKQAIEEADQSR